MNHIERRIRVEQEWVRRNVMADHQNDERYEAYNWRRGLGGFDWDCMTSNVRVFIGRNLPAKYIRTRLGKPLHGL